MAAFPDHPFWEFSLRVYGRPGVAPACLALQDRYDLDVNLLLLCCWIGHSRAAPPSRDDIARLCQAIAGWHRNVVRPLRGVRRWLKSPGTAVPPALADALRQAVKATELDAEHIEQLGLAAALDGGDGGRPAAPMPEHAVAALRYFFEISGISPDGADQDRLAVLLAAAFPEAEAGRLEALLRRPDGP